MNSFLGFILFADKILFLFRSKVAPPQLVLANPDDGFIAAGKRFLVDGERDFRVLLGDGEAVVSIHDQSFPYDDGVDDTAIPQDVRFKLVQFFKSERRDFALKLRVNFKRR